jgi:hypothetical protein
VTPAEHLDAAIAQLVERGLLLAGEQRVTLHVTAANTVRRVEALPASLPAKVTFGRQAMHRPAA